MRGKGASPGVPRTYLFVLLSTIVSPVLFFSTIPSSSQAQVSPPITATTGTGSLGTTITPAGNVYNITGGARPGNGPNLFHSFGEFGVPTNNIANFLNTPVNEVLPATSSILGRVTAGNPSNIFGTIQTTGFGNANLFLMNPAGFLFGPNATVNVGGMVTFTSANYLRLEEIGGSNSGIFHADPTQVSILTTAPVAVFGFLGSNPGAITVQGSQFTVSEGQGISLVGGNITIEGGPLGPNDVQSAQLSAPSGRVHLASAASPGEFLAGTLEQAANTNGQSFGTLGTIQVSGKSVIDVSGDGGGTVSIHGGRFVLNDSTIVANTTGPAAGPLAAENRGAVTLSASDIQLENGATIQTNAENAGNAGTITIQGLEGNGSAATNVTLDNATLSTTISGGNAASTPGAITITADTVTLNNGTYMTADTLGAAPAGNIMFNVGALTAKGGPIRLQVSPESLITNPTFSQTGVLIESTSRSLDVGAGQAGQITIQGANGSGNAAGSVSLDDTILHTRSFGGTAATVPGAITITADTVTLSNQVEIYATTNGAAPAGNVALNVNQLRSNVNPDGSFVERNPVFIGSPSEKPDSSAGPPGTVTISGPGAESTDPAKLVTLSNTEIDTFAVGGSSPTPAPIVITADTVALSNLTILVTTSGGAAPAPAGDIVFNVNTLRVNMNPDGTPITSAERVFINSPSGRLDSTAGPPGTVTISGLGPESTDAAKLVALYNAQMSTAVEGGTEALAPGTITITADTMTLSGRTEIFAFTSSPAPAGNIALNVNSLRANVNPDGTLINDGQPRSLIASVSVGENSTAGRAGTVTISGLGPESTDSARLIALNNMEVSTNVGGGTAPTVPATITMTADTIRLTNSRDIRTDTSGGAPAGNMTFNVNNLTADQATQISSSTSGEGHGGNIAISAGQSVTLNNGSLITASSTGSANAGDISINAGRSYTSTNSSVTTQAAQASGGNITVLATDIVWLTNSQINASVQGSSTTIGGNIVIDPNFVILQNSQILAQATQGQGGNISITAGTFLADSSSTVSASSQFGLSGTVAIQSPISQLAGRLSALPKDTALVTSLLGQRCAAQANGQYSSFVLAGRETLPFEPGGWLASPLALTSLTLEGRGNEMQGEMLSLRRMPFTGAIAQVVPVDWMAGCGYDRSRW